MISLRGSARMPTALRKAAVGFGVGLATLLLITACSQRGEPVKVLRIGDPLAANRVTVNASSLPNEPFVQSWLVKHKAPFVLPVALADVQRVQFVLGSASSWLVSFNSWFESHTVQPPETLLIQRARWQLLARNERDEVAEASVELEPGLELLLAGACSDEGCPYRFADPAQASNWLSFGVDRAEVSGLVSGWLRPRDDVNVSVSLAVWIGLNEAALPGAADADYLSATFALVSSDASVLITSARQ